MNREKAQEVRFLNDLISLLADRVKEIEEPDYIRKKARKGKLSEEDVSTICHESNRRISNTKMAEMYGVSQQYISLLRSEHDYKRGIKR